MGEAMTIMFGIYNCIMQALRSHDQAALGRKRKGLTVSLEQRYLKNKLKGRHYDNALEGIKKILKGWGFGSQKKYEELAKFVECHKLETITPEILFTEIQKALRMEDHSSQFAAHPEVVRYFGMYFIQALRVAYPVAFLLGLRIETLHALFRYAMLNPASLCFESTTPKRLRSISHSYYSGPNALQMFGQTKEISPEAFSRLMAERRKCFEWGLIQAVGIAYENTMDVEAKAAVAIYHYIKKLHFEKQHDCCSLKELFELTNNKPSQFFYRDMIGEYEFTKRGNDSLLFRALGILERVYRAIVILRIDPVYTGAPSGTNDPYNPSTWRIYTKKAYMLEAMMVASFYRVVAVFSMDPSPPRYCVEYLEALGKPGARPAHPLCSEQEYTIAALENFPVVSGLGMPGSGKTEALAEVVRRYGTEKVLVLGFTNTQVATVRRRIENVRATTVHNLFYKHHYLCDKCVSSSLCSEEDKAALGKKRSEFRTRLEDNIAYRYPDPHSGNVVYASEEDCLFRPPFKRCFLEDVEILCIDEIGTLSTELASVALLLAARCMRIKRLFFTGDKNQNRPISPGDFLEVLCHAFQKGFVEYQHNHRAKSQAIVDVVKYILDVGGVRTEYRRYLGGTQEQLWYDDKTVIMEYMKTATARSLYSNSTAQEYASGLKYDQLKELIEIIHRVVRKYNLTPENSMFISRVNSVCDSLSCHIEGAYLNKPVNFPPKKNEIVVGMKIVYTNNDSSMGVVNNEQMIVCQVLHAAPRIATARSASAMQYAGPTPVVEIRNPSSSLAASTGMSLLVGNAMLERARSMELAEMMHTNMLYLGAEARDAQVGMRLASDSDVAANKHAQRNDVSEAVASAVRSERYRGKLEEYKTLWRQYAAQWRENEKKKKKATTAQKKKPTTVAGLGVKAEGATGNEAGEKAPYRHVVLKPGDIVPWITSGAVKLVLQCANRNASAHFRRQNRRNRRGGGRDGQEEEEVDDYVDPNFTEIDQIDMVVRGISNTTWAQPDPPCVRLLLCRVMGTGLDGTPPQLRVIPYIPGSTSFDNIKKASAWTTYSMQGYQSQTVCVIKPNLSMYDTREELCTAASRASDRLIFVSNHEILSKAIDQLEPTRNSFAPEAVRFFCEPFLGDAHIPRARLESVCQLEETERGKYGAKDDELETSFYLSLADAVEKEKEEAETMAALQAMIEDEEEEEEKKKKKKVVGQKRKREDGDDDAPPFIVLPKKEKESGGGVKQEPL